MEYVQIHRMKHTVHTYTKSLKKESKATTKKGTATHKCYAQKE